MPRNAGSRRRAGIALVRHALAVLVVTGAVGAARAQDKQITWTLFEAAPYMIVDGPDRDTGIADRIRHLLRDRLDDYSHMTLVVPFPRVVSALKSGADWCFVGGIKTAEREAFAYFSLPVAMFYPLKIVVHASQRARFEALAPLSLRTLLQEHRDLRTSILRDRALGLGINALFRQSPSTQVFSEFGEVFRMLLNDRLDYLVEYTSIATYNAARLGAAGAVVGLPFAESPEPVFNRVMCAKTPWGRAVVDRIDAVLRAERPSPVYRAIVESWMAEDDLPTVRALYDTTFLTSE